MDDEPINLHDLAAARGTTRWILYRLASRGHLPFVTVDGQVRVRPSDYDNYIRNER
jgi:hypothetical protein